MRISDWSSDVCSSDLRNNQIASRTVGVGCEGRNNRLHFHADTAPAACERGDFSLFAFSCHLAQRLAFIARSEEHTSELQSLMRISYAVFCLKKKKQQEDILTIQDNKQIQTATQTTRPKH